MLGAAQQQALDALRRDGVAVVSFADLLADEPFWAELEADMRVFVEETERELPQLGREEREAVYGKSFLIRRFRAKKGEKRPALALDNPWVRLGISDRLLAVVNAYRGEEVRLHDVDTWYTVPEPDADRRIASQRWHRDGWEDHIVKVFTYFSDVDADAGAFEYLLGSPSGGKYGSLWPWQDKEVYPAEDEFAAAVDETDCRVLAGSPGTMVICDTSGFHRGGFARSRPRILSYLTYLSDEGARRHKRKFDLDRSSSDGELSPAARFALS